MVRILNDWENAIASNNIPGGAPQENAMLDNGVLDAARVVASHKDMGAIAAAVIEATKTSDLDRNGEHLGADITKSPSPPRSMTMLIPEATEEQWRRFFNRGLPAVRRWDGRR